jgi:hypothetical protein
MTMTRRFVLKNSGDLLGLAAMRCLWRTEIA